MKVKKYFCVQQPPYTYMSPLSIQRCSREPCLSRDLHCWLAFCSGGSYWLPMLSITVGEPIRRWGQGKAQCVIGHTELWFRSTGMGPEKRRIWAALYKNPYTEQVNRSRTCLILKKDKVLMFRYQKKTYLFRPWVRHLTRRWVQLFRQDRRWCTRCTHTGWTSTIILQCY